MIVLLRMLCVLLPGAGGLHIQVSYQYDGYYNYGKVEPEVRQTAAYWFNSDVMVYETDTIRYIVDSKEKSIILIQKKSKIYVKIDLTKQQIPEIVDERIKGFFQTDRAGGNIQPGYKKAIIQGFTCHLYDRVYWNSDQESIFEKRKESIWLTRKAGINIESYRLLKHFLLDLYEYAGNWEPGFIKELKEIRGFPVKIESLFYIKGSQRKGQMRLIRMVKQAVPAEMLSIPGDFKKIDRLTLDYIHTNPYYGSWGLMRW